MFEDDWSFKAADGKTVYGRNVQRSRNLAEDAIIFVHGLTCDFTDMPYLSAARLLARRGYDCILFNLYDWRDGARSLNDCTLRTHAADFDAVASRRTKTYRNVFAVGHSYGGPTLLQARCRGVRAVSLWDPSYAIADWWPQWTVERNKLKFLRGPTDILVSNDMDAEALALDTEACRDLGRRFRKPLQVLHAGQGILHRYGESFHAFSRAQTDYHLIGNADHCFTTRNALNAVVRKTHDWFQHHKADAQ